MPRSTNLDAGLRGISRDPFPAGARATAPHLGFVTEVQVERATKTKSAGVEKFVWANHGTPVPGRLDYLGARLGPALVAEQVSEAASAVVTTVRDIDVTTMDRVRVDGRTFEVLAVHIPSDALVAQLEVN